MDIPQTPYPGLALVNLSPGTVDSNVMHVGPIAAVPTWGAAMTRTKSLGPINTNGIESCDNDQVRMLPLKSRV